MQDFSLYFALGKDHILDWQALDHLLFILALCGTYLLVDWPKVLWLVTAFTIGHSITLALSVFNWLNFSSAWIELLIPITIILAALANLSKKPVQKAHHLWKYLMALCFGLIHGLGFSFYLKSLLGTDSSIISQLLAFNLGLEFGQIIIVITILAIAQLLVRKFQVAHREWIIFLSAAAFSLALQMSVTRLIALNQFN